MDSLIFYKIILLFYISTINQLRYFFYIIDLKNILQIDHDIFHRIIFFCSPIYTLFYSSIKILFY